MQLRAATLRCRAVRARSNRIRLLRDRRDHERTAHDARPRWGHSIKAMQVLRMRQPESQRTCRRPHKKGATPARTPMVRVAVSRNVNRNNTSLMIMHEYTRRHVHVTSFDLT
jgi:hypothetical protein